MLNDKYKGMSNTRIYCIWMGMKQRCENQNHKNYKYYGGIGIKILWNSFEEFADDMYISYLEHALIHGENDTTIERIDPYKDYCKDNCKWATHKEQANNKRFKEPSDTMLFKKKIADGYKTVPMVAELLNVTETSIKRLIDPSRNHRWLLDDLDCCLCGNKYLFSDEGVKYIAYQYMSKSDECFYYVYPEYRTTEESDKESDIDD